MVELQSIDRKALGSNPGHSLNRKFSTLTLVMIGGGGLMCPPFFLFIFLLKISPLDQTLRPTCKFLILAIFYHAKKNPENFVYKKFYCINS